MRTVRFSIAALMAVVLIVALGLAALRNSSATWAGVTFLLTCAVLCLAIVGIVCDGDVRRAWWLGFALFSSVYFSSALISENKLYGTIGVVFILMAWFIAIGAVIVLGAACGAVWQERKNRGVPRSRR